MAASTRPSLWDSVLELTKSVQYNNTEPLHWTVQLSSKLQAAGVVLPSTEIAQLLVSHICFDNHVPVTWKLLEKALTFNIAPRLLVFALLSNRIVPNRKLYPSAYRLYLELVKRHIPLFALQIKCPNYVNIMKSIDDELHLSHIFGIPMSEPGVLLVEFVLSVIWQLVDASLDDEGLMQLTSDKKSKWLTRQQDMDIDGKDTFYGKTDKQRDGLNKVNVTMAIELIEEILRNKITSRILFLARRNMPSHWEEFSCRFRLLIAHSAALRNLPHISPKSLLELTSDTPKVLCQKGKTTSKEEFHAVICSSSLSDGQCHGVSRSALWLPIDLYLEDAMDGSQVTATAGFQVLAGLLKALQAVNHTSWHDTFLALWVAALRLVQRERDSSEAPVPGLDTSLSLLLCITTLAVAEIIGEDESGQLNGTESSLGNQRKETLGRGKCREGLISSLQQLGDYEGLLTPPEPVSTLVNQAVVKAAMFISGLNVSSGYYESNSTSEMSVNYSGNLRHLIVEACIARNLLGTSAYLWPGYVKMEKNQVPISVSSQMGWSSLMKGLPLTPPLVNILVATPASSLSEIEKIFEIAISGSDDEKISAATILCGASLVRGWNIQEHTMLSIIRLLSPPVPADYPGSESHLTGYARVLNVLLLGISPVNCVQILSLHGLVPLLAGALMPICEAFGSNVPKDSWTVPNGEEISCHSIFTNAFTLLLRLWRFDRPALENVVGDLAPVGSLLTPELLLLVRNSQLATCGASPKDYMKPKRYSKILNPSVEPVFLDAFPRLKNWHRQHQECIASAFSGLVHCSTIHQTVDAMLSTLFRKMNRVGQPFTSSTSGSSSPSATGTEDEYARLKIPAWDILEATPFALDASLTACAHGELSPRELTTGLKDLADFLPATLVTIVSYFSAEVTRGVWKEASMNGIDWPSPVANLSNVEQQMKKILADTGVDIPSLTVGRKSPTTLPLPLAAVLSLTITYKLDKVSERLLTLIGPALNSLAAGCPWPCMPVITSLWAQKAKRWSDFLIFSASKTVFHHNSDAVVQLLKCCFTSTLGFGLPHIPSNGGVGSLLGHGIGSQYSGGIRPVSPGILYLRVRRSVRNAIFLTEEILSLLMHSVRDVSRNGLAKETIEKLKKIRHGTRYGRVSLAAAFTRVKIAASLGASLVWISGGSGLVQVLVKETLPSWFISVHRVDQELDESGGLVAMLQGYALAYFAILCGTFAWGVDSESTASKRRPKVLEAHLEFLASAVDGKISFGCDLATARAYVSGFVSLMVSCTPAWVREVDVDILKRLSKGLKQWNEDKLALALLELGGVTAMGAAAELICEAAY